MNAREAGRLAEQLTYDLNAACERMEISLDTYDADFILGVIMTWLGSHGDLALTSSGLRRVRSVR